MAKIIFILLVCQITLAHAVDVEMCGPPPGIISSLFTDAEAIRIRCIDDAYKANKEKVNREVAELNAMIVKVEAEIKKVAIVYNMNEVKCAPSPGKSRDPKLVQKCRDLLNLRNGIVVRIDKLMGWYKAPAPTPTQTSGTHIDPPCPTGADLEKMKMARMFNGRLMTQWNNCEIDRMSSP